tara:strand:- start:858 stop:1316 length:459 start_codon:yes stop_codon:yes gene_type:complete
MEIKGHFNVSASRAEVWECITDPEVVGSCIPGCESIEVISDNLYKAAIEVKIGPIKARFRVDVDVTEEVAPDHIISNTRGEEGGRASVISANNILELRDSDAGGTDVYYSSDVMISGRLGKYGHGIMKKVAKNLSEKFADAFRDQVETSKVV